MMGCLDDDRSQSRSVGDDEGVEENEDVVDPEGDQDVWAQSEGYTPLSDIQYSSLMVSLGPDDDDDDSTNEGYARGGDGGDNNQGGDNEIGGGEASSSRAPSGPFFVDAAALSTDRGQNVSQDSVSDDLDGFQGMADKALSILDQEYERTLRGEHRPPSWQATVAQASPSGMELAGASMATPQTEQDVEDMKAIVAAFDSRKTELQKFSNPEGETSFFPVHWDKEPSTAVATSPHKSKDAPPVDTDAVRKAVQVLSKKDAPFQKKFAAWQGREPTLPLTHELIPTAPYKAFRRNTDKAIVATASLSRSATLAEILVRLRERRLLQNTGTLQIHVIGVDHVECESAERIQTTFQPIVRWLGVWMKHIFSSVHIDLIGRDLTEAAATLQDVDLLTPNNRLCRATASCHSGVYHEWLESQEDPTKSPHLIVAYNAGIWGYQEWQPTLRYLCDALPNPVPVVITAYTLDECHEDFESIQETVATAGKAGQLLWGPEMNPFGSKKVRETHSSSQTYRENASWQAWLLGGNPST